MTHGIRILAAVAMILAIGPASDAAPVDAVAETQPPGRERAPGTVTLTLVTGDRVILRGGAVERIMPGADREEVRFSTFWLSGDLHVIPSDAGRLLAAGQLDERLFNVTQQVAWGYDDARLDSVPVIVERSPSQRRTDVGGASMRRSFGSIGLDVGRVEKSQAAGFWRDLTTSPHARRLDDGVRGLWLDGQVEAALDKSVAQIGAPAAWRRGLTGKGVRVAVLDSGYARGHPDLAGAVVRARGFTSEGPDDVVDRDGHGTHVASTITGSGAASDGRYKGAAPQAKLVIGKVLEFGSGYESWIIAGMRWATRVADADIVNMSLGGWDFRGTDPLERAVNLLSRETGALFVVAAGNDGSLGEHSISSPASAAAALAVGAVDNQNRLAAFSGRGPVLGTEAVKPDLTAPGVAVKAAVPGGGYASASGTSMAAPHVAGAAAVLAQQHPRWTANQLKAALIGSARPTAGVGEFAQGAGRVAVRRAIRQPVIATPANLSTVLRFPQHRTVTRPVTYTNTSDAPVTLRLSPLDRPFHIEDTTITVPAHGRRTTDVTISAQEVEAGAFSSTLTARSGRAVVRTLLGAYVEPPSYNLRIDVTDRRRVLDTLMLVHSQTKDFHAWVPISDERAQVRLPADDYNLVNYLVTKRPRERYLFTLVNQPVDLSDDDTNVTLDLRLAERPTMTLDEPTAVAESYASVGVIYERSDASYFAADEFGSPANALRVLPARVRGATYFHYRSWHQRDTRFSPYAYHIVDWREGGIPDDPLYAASTNELAKVTTTYKETQPTSTGLVWVGLTLPNGIKVNGGGHRVRLPGTVTQYFTPRPELRWPRQVETAAYTLDDTGTPPSYAPGHHHETWNAAVLGPALPEACAPTTAGETGTPPCAYRTGDILQWWGDVTFDTDAGDRGRRSITGFGGQVTLHREGKLVQTCKIGYSNCLAARVPPQPATYRLVVNAHRYDLDPTRLTTEVRAAYTFESGLTDEETALPFIAVRYAPEGLGLQNRAAAGSTTTIPIWTEKYSDAPIESMTVEASYDDAATWHALNVERNGPDWVTSVDNPDSGFVSLRAIAVDSDGNSVRQVIVRAYEIRG